MKLKLYRISQDVNYDYDTYDGAIVCAENAEEARATKLGSKDNWVPIHDVKVEYIGRARKEMEKGIVLSSFRAS